MNNFKIYCKDNVILTVNDKNKTYQKGKTYGFIGLTNKEIKAIRKKAIKENNIVFTLCDDMTGCYAVTYGEKKVKDQNKENLINMNKGKKNSKPIKIRKKTNIEPVPSIENNNIIDNGGDEVNGQES